MNRTHSVFFLIFLLIFSACSSRPKPKYTKKIPANKTTVVTKTIAPARTPEITKEREEELRLDLPEVPREFRAVWIASVANINWPSRQNLSVEQQKNEAVALLDFVEENNLNTVILQIRPSADALYQSDLEPWSYFLSGQIGQAPNPFYDPLSFWISESHKRGLELHVWLNPFRAHHSSGGAITSESMVKKSPENVVKLRNGMVWFDPGNQKTQDHVSAVVKDILKRYDVDGIHFDDYFYPYKSYNNGAEFPDQNSWKNYQNSGGTLSRDDWRRDNVNRFVERIYKEIKTEKNEVKFGISPFGIWMSGFPEGVKGTSQYSELYADAKLWLNKGWVDYFSPQLYWSIDAPQQSFPALLKWWKEENNFNRHLWPGLNTIEVKTSDRTSEIINQIKLVREILPTDAGEIHWSIAGLTKNLTLSSNLKNGLYRQKALVPRSTWLNYEPIAKPEISATEIQNQIQIGWKTSSENAANWVLYLQYGQDWETQILSRSTEKLTVPKIKNGKTLKNAAIRMVDKVGELSDYAGKKIK